MLTKNINGFPFIRYTSEERDKHNQIEVSAKFLDEMKRRRSIRQFSDKPVSPEMIQNILRTANTAPSGANLQPWTFCAIKDNQLKKKIRVAAEQEEYENYNGRMPEEWLKDLAPFQTDWDKTFLETAPWLIIVFKKSYDINGEGKKKNNYYAVESTGIATGFLITAIHIAGLVTLTHTPSPMNFLSKILDRPANEKPFLLLPVGYPADECWVPDIKKKSMEEVSVFY